MLEFGAVSFSYPSAPSKEQSAILREVTFRCRAGEVLGVVGGSGSGKTTLLRLAAGLLLPTSGSVLGSGSSTGHHWLSPQTPVLIDFRTSTQNALLGREALRKLNRSDAIEANSVLTGLGLAGSKDRIPSELSGGMRRRVALAQAILSDRELVLLDEPFAELDSIARNMAEQAIFDRPEPKSTVMLVSHDLDSVCALCDRVLVLSGPPRLEAAMIGVGRSMEPFSGPKARRASPAFAESAAALQKAILVSA